MNQKVTFATTKSENEAQLIKSTKYRKIGPSGSFTKVAHSSLLIISFFSSEDNNIFDNNDNDYEGPSGSFTKVAHSSLLIISFFSSEDNNIFDNNDNDYEDWTHCILVAFSVFFICFTNASPIELSPRAPGDVTYVDFTKSVRGRATFTELYGKVVRALGQFSAGI
ncbi:hypothetical protein Glove_420g116 [Diversispora epigaea]|uniref:Uncharacterized protein n=1 Tax=Diversispora epigaea TaxID=1348612 RepID=A0A397H0G7_9GLOM|nr:hypothetical protein Glove_420g116 [Diversispora epigaea]